MSLDFLVYGASVEGLCVASFLHQNGFKVTVFEPSAKIGGSFAPVEFRTQNVKSLFSSLARNEDITHAVQSISQKLNLNLDLSEQNESPTTFEKGHFEPFVGFGDNAPKGVEFLSDFSSAQRQELEPSLETLIQNISSSGLEIRLQMTMTSVTTENGRITEVLMNEKEKVRAENIIFAVHPSEVTELVDKNLISAKTVSKLSKVDYWSAIQLSVLHGKAVTDKKEIHFLYGTQKDPVVSVGHFAGVAGVHSSQWISLLPADSLEIHEAGTQILKEMKRQIKRAYPEAFDHVTFEKISFLPMIYGYAELKSKYFGQIEGLENLCLCSGHLIEGTSPVGNAIKAALMTIQLIESLMTKTAENSNNPSELGQINA